MTTSASSDDLLGGIVPCRSCSSPLESGQRYCLNCGRRHGAPRVESGPVLVAIAVASLAAARSGGLPPSELQDEAFEGAAEDASEAGGSSVATLATAFASKSAASTGLALLVVGMVAGAAFSPPAAESLAAQQRVVIVQAAGAPAEGPAAEPTSPTPEVPAAAEIPVDDPTPSPAPAPVPTPVVPPTVPVDPSIGHVAFVLLPGGADGQELITPTVSRRSRGRMSGAKASSTASYQSAFAGMLRKGFFLKGFKHVSTSGFANRYALLTGADPTDEMVGGCNGTVPALESTKGCLVPKPDGDPGDVISLATQALASQGQAIRVYVETPEREDNNYSSICTPPRPGDSVVSPGDGTPPLGDNPVLWFRSLTGPVPISPGDWKAEDSPLCFMGGNSGSVRPLSMMADDLRRAAAQDAENFDPTVPSAFPKITFVVPSRCRVDAAVRCPDGVTAGGPAALREFLDEEVSATLAESETFRKDGFTLTSWDRAPAGATTPRGAIVLSPFVKAGGSNASAYNTYGLLATIQSRFGLAGDLGQPPLLGKSSTAKQFGPEVFPRR